MKEIDDVSIDLILADPPYCCKYSLIIVSKWYNMSMNTINIKNLYTKENWSLRRIAEKYKTDHHKIKRILKDMGIAIVRKPKKPITKAHRENISIACKGRKTWSKGKRMPKSSLYKNMASHLRFDIDSEWFMQFDDIEKLKFLNRCISQKKDRFKVSDEWYKEYIIKFYNDKQFNTIYIKWFGSNDKYLRPTIDHINPKANGGNNDISNLQFLTWFENRAKNDMSQNEWNKLKKNIGEYFV